MEEKQLDITAAENIEVAIRPEQEAVIITERIRANGSAAAVAVCNIGKDLRRMKVENLFTHLGYESFEDYAEKEFRIKKRQAYLYISVYEKLGEEFVQSNAQLGITRLSLLSMANPEDRAEIMDNNDVAGMTTKELEELISKYKVQGEQLSLLEDECSKYESDLDEAKDTIMSLEKQLEEYENRPQEVKVAEKEVIKEVIKEVPDKKTEEKLKKKSQELINANLEREKVKKELNAVAAEMVAQEDTINRMRKEIEELKKVSVKPAESPDKSSFKAAYASVYKEITGLIELIKAAGDDEKSVFIERTEALVSALSDKLKEVTNG